MGDTESTSEQHPCAVTPPTPPPAPPVRTGTRHPRLKGASLEFLIALAARRNRRGLPTVYALRAASRLLGDIMREERRLHRNRKGIAQMQAAVYFPRQACLLYTSDAADE